MINKLSALIVFLSIAISSQAAPFSKGNSDEGKKSVDQHKCNACHIRKMGGDGSAIYTRPDHKIKSPASLATQISTCSTNLGLMLFEDEEENLGAYLNKTFYKFK